VRFAFAALIVLSTRFAYADDAELARGLFKKGVEEYKAKKYDVAAATLAKSYELDPKPDALFALAQSERLAGRCKDAVPHYKKLLEQTTDLPTLKAVQSNLELCEPPKPETTTTPDEPKPEIKVVEKPVDRIVEKPVTRTVTRTERKTDWLMVGGFAGGALAVGTSIGFFVAASGNSSAADDASTLAESNRLYDRSVDQKRLGFVAGAVGAAAIGFGVYRFVTKRSVSKAEVAIVPTAAGATAWVGARW
jgi:tetratricopeptide (TPR) repeat protein